MTLYKFPSGKIVSDEEYGRCFAEEYPSDRPEASKDYIFESNDKARQVVFEEMGTEDDD